MRILIACEFSGTVRNAFAALGHDAWSVDLLPTEQPGNHIQGDVLRVLDDGWDMMVAHPPCTHLAVSGAAWFKDKIELQKEALQFVRNLMNAPIPMIAIENPVSVIATKIRKPDQVIQPYWFGHPDRKSTCLWLRDLPLLTPTHMVKLAHTGRNANPLDMLPPSDDRWKLRSKTYQGIADAMAAQWGAWNAYTPKLF